MHTCLPNVKSTKSTKYLLTNKLLFLLNSYCLQKTFTAMSKKYNTIKGQLNDLTYVTTLFLFSFSNPGVSVSGGKTTETATLYGFT